MATLRNWGVALAALNDPTAVSRLLDAIALGDAAQGVLSRAVF